MRGLVLVHLEVGSDLVDLPSHRVRVSFSATNNEHHCPLYLSILVPTYGCGVSMSQCGLKGGLSP